MIAWMVYAVLVGAFLAVGARAAEWLGRLAGLRVRWVWAGAIAGVLLFSASARRGADRAAETVVIASTGTVKTAFKSQPGLTKLLLMRAVIVREAIDERLRAAIGGAQRLTPPSLRGYVVAAWVVASAGLLMLMAGVSHRFRRARRAWPLGTVQGVGVRIAPQVGPVVLGFVQPEIIVPRWLLTRTDDEQRLVVAHEDEHVRARDPLLLAFAWLAVIVAPWNPALWYMLSRLRLAVELDCDARVLRRGATPRSYGSLLIDVAENASGLRLSALALADQSSHLHQRILAMKPRTPRFVLARAGAAGALGLAAILAACEAHLPTAGEIDRMDAASAEKAAVLLAKTKHADTTVEFVVDGTRMNALKARAISKDSIASIEVVTTAGQAAQVKIRKLNKAADGLKTTVASADREAATAMRMGGQRGRRGDSTESPMNALRLRGTASTTGTPMIFIDGVLSTQAAMKALDPKSIESVEVLKGAAAARAFSDPAAANGVITITTKR